MKHHSPRFLAVTDAARAAVVEITPEALLTRLAAGERPAVVDVREDREWNAGRVPFATHLGKGVIERDVEKVFPDPDTELVLYCGGGFRSALAARSLAEMGYTRVLSLAGGERGWREAGGAWTTEPPPGA